ncbi:MAG: LysM peptidoglycan-binding domain-containing protein [Bacillota bacterium]
MAGLAFGSGVPALAAVKYTVKAGDTLWGISNKYGVSVNQLKAINSLQGELLSIGQVLVIPGTGTGSPGAPPSRSASTVHVVKAGDTLWQIAQKYNTSVSAIMSANRLASDRLQIGQRLSIPRAADYQSQAARPKNLSTLPPAPVSRSGDGVARDILDVAHAQLGKPYVWGSSGPDGFDCSGFTSYVFKQFGISLSHSSYEQFKQGVSVSSDELQPGDLVFFTTYSKGASHVGIYTGDGQFIHASSSKGITYTSMSDSWYGPRYLGARRML